MNLLRGRAIFLLFLTVLFCTVLPVHAADYPALKNIYIANHPGQSIIPFPWEPTSSEKVLPFNYDIPAAPKNSLSITATRGEFEPASVIIFAREDISGITITTPTLYSTQGNSIPASATDVRLVKVWYQATDVDDIWLTHIDKTLKPELLLKDDSLVRVDYANQMNYLRVSVNGVQQYIDITSPSAAFPSNAQVHDAQTLQPFTMAANENKQIWLTVHVPETTPAGDYRGDITIAAPGEIPVLMNFTVTVLPFDLEPAPLEYGLYYRGEIPADVNGEMQKTGITFEFKTPKQYRAELQDMKDHGVLYPTLNNEFPYWNSTTNPYLTALKSALAIRRQVGLPLDNIYYLRIQPRNPTDQASLAAIAENTRRAKSIFTAYGCRNMYLYGIDEASGSVLQSERPAWQTVKQNGGKMFVAGYSDLIDYVGDLLDVPVLAHSLDTSQAARWHRLGKKLFNYANPQVGVENPELYRRNYGFALWNAGYDGEMDYAYQHAFGNIWNDFDSVDTHFRDHVFAYPTTDGVIDTIQWEGFREGVDDTRYLATLIKKEGNNVSAKTIVSRSLSEDNMPVIRRQLINRILSSSTDPTTPPVAGFTATPVSGTSPLTVTFRDVSTNFPTSWRWSFGDGSSVNATARNPVHTYSAPGTYTVTLIVTNAAGSDRMTRTGYITVTRAGAGPVASFTATPVSGTSPLKVRFSDTSSNSPASWNWSIRNTAGGAVVYFGKKNLLSLNQANGAEAGISAEFQPNNGGETLTSSTEYAWQGKRSIKIVTPGTNAYEGMYLTPKVSVSPSTRYTGSVYVRGAKGGEVINLYLEEKTSDNTHISFKFSGDITLTTRWQRIAITSPASAGCRKLLIGVLSEDTNLATVYVDGLQLERGSSATVWTGDAVQNPGYTFTTPGTYTVTLRVTNAAGSNIMTRNGYIRVA